MKSKAHAACLKRINILVVVDTDAIMAADPDPSSDPDCPTPIGDENRFLLCGGARKTKDGGDLKFNASIGDYVAIAGTSIYDNADTAAIVYDVRRTGEQQVFNAFSPAFLTRTHAVMPDPDTETGIPPLTACLDFASFGSRVKQHGVGELEISFGVYALADDGEMQELFGYYSCRALITVGTIVHASTIE